MTDTVTVLSDIACKLGEGPTYDPATGTLYWFDIVDCKLLEKQMPDGRVIVHSLPVMASALAVVDAERQLLVTERGLELRDKTNGALTLHKAVEADNSLTRCNDSRVHPAGALWFGTMAKEEGGPAAGAIYWYKYGEVRQLYSGIAIPNSICFSPDGTIAYFTDTAKNKLMRVACDPVSGLPNGEPKLLIDHDGVPGWIDGSVCDADGVIWNARWGAGRVDAYAPDGKPLRSIAVGARQSSCPAFVGRRGDHLAVTSAWKGMDAAERAADPQGGFTFLIDAKVNGRFDPPVAL
jgi:sugar lactone lactonase YvrE